MEPLPQPLDAAPSAGALPNDDTDVSDSVGLVIRHLVLFGLCGPIAGMLCLPVVLLFAAGPADALMMLVVLLIGTIMGIGLVYAFYAGAAPAVIVGLLVALLHVRGASERTLYVGGAILGIVTTSSWMLIIPDLDIPIFQRSEAEIRGSAFIFMSIVGALSALAMTRLSRRFRRPRICNEQKVLDQF
nr:hypothetical protein [uncultured Dongia sp.]